MDVYAKVETAFAAYLESALPAGTAVRRARQGGPSLEGPLVLIHATTATDTDQLPPGDGTLFLDLSLMLIGAKGQLAAALAEPLGYLQSALLDVSGAQDQINTTANALHLHDIEIADHTPDVQDNRPSHSITARLTITNAAA